MLKKLFFLFWILKTAVQLNILEEAIKHFCRDIWWIESLKEQHVYEIAKF